MSDQPSPPRELRLKLKLQPAKAADAPPPDPATPEEPPPAAPKADNPVTSPPGPAAGFASAEAPGAAPEKIKLRTRIPIKPADGEEPPVPASPAPPPAPAETDVAPAEEIPRPEVPTESLEIAESLPPMPVDLPLPGAAPAPLPDCREGAEVGPHIRLKSGVVVSAGSRPPGGEVGAASAPAAAEKKAARPHRDRLGLLARVAGLMLVLAVVYLAYRRYSQIAPHRGESMSAENGSLVSGTAKTAPAPQTVYGRAVQKARDAAAASDRLAGAANEAVGAMTSPAPAASPLPSPRFRALIDRLKIGGVRVGPPARLFLDGMTYEAGDVIDGSLGVMFVGVDVKTNELLFKDSTGAVIRRPF